MSAKHNSDLVAKFLMRCASRPHVVVIVLGDLGRSPRMLNHARAFRERGWRVTLAGALENALPEDLANDSDVRVWDLRANGGGLLREVLTLGKKLATDDSWHLALVQNPPGFPAVFAAWLAHGARGADVAMDWHNLGFTLLALAPNRGRVAVALYRVLEKLPALSAGLHIAVSRALAQWLGLKNVRVIHDAPSARAKVVRPTDRAAWWQRVWPDQPMPRVDAHWVAAPSSWGRDEDLDALRRVAHLAATRSARWRDSRLVVFATGRGPGREAFERALKDLPPGPIEIRTGWLPPGAYPEFLTLADGGLCLHVSSSGLDLPMKLADFRGAWLPALVRDYGSVLDELAADGTLERFRTDEELEEKLRHLAQRESLPPAMPTAETWETRWHRALDDWLQRFETEVVV